jgi:hypothetical protein
MKIKRKNMRRRAAAAVGSTCLRHYALERFRSARVLSTLLRSPPRRRALHLLVFSTSSTFSPPHLLYSLVAFSTSTSRSPPPRRILHLLVFSIPVSCFPCRCRATLALLPSTPALHFPRRRSRSGTLCRRRISSFIHCRVALWIAPYAGIMLLSCCGRVSRRGGRYAGGVC